MRKLFITLMILLLCHNSLMAHVESIDVLELQRKLESSTETIFLLDVRSKQEYQSGHIKNSINIPHDVLIKDINLIGEYRNEPLVVYCRSGVRAQLVIDKLLDNDFNHIIDINGDMLAWIESDLPIEKD
ncbi:MAG TPA: rhodanese-like domain-containing protein [Gammaproteobacteria bacterium]|nr:rhodanese-like domain-containing protein [Gammaproteobacteria bacterium]HJP43243.1 rhodanese-like domain-containing protein [Gammaproteobacteria bacterium]